MTGGAVLLLLAGLVLAGVGLAQQRAARRNRLAQALELELAGSPAPTQALALALQRTMAWADSRTEGTPWRERMLTRLERARVNLRPAEYVGLRVAAVVGGAVLGLVLHGPVLALLLALVGVVLPPLVLARRSTKRQRAFEAQLPDVLDLVASSMEAGHALLTALALVAEDAPAPLGPEVARVLAETEMGRPVLEALEAMAHRVDVQDLDWTVQGIRIQSEVGGRLSEMLRTLAGFMRAREEVRRELRALTAEGKLSAYVLGALPVLMLLFMVFMARAYVDPLFTTPAGRILLGAAGVMMVGSALAMRKIVDVEV